MSWHGVSLALAPVLFTSLAAAESAEHFHDGLYAQVGVGYGHMFTEIVLDPEPDDPPDMKLKGPGYAGHLFVGGTPAEGIAIGAGALGVFVPSATLLVDDQASGDDDDAFVTLVGPVADVYPLPHLGFHAQALVGYAWLRSDKLDSETPDGFGVAVGVGYEWWLMEQWGVGLLGRVTYAATSTRAGSVKTQYSSLVPGLLLTATLH